MLWLLILALSTPDVLEPCWHEPDQDAAKIRSCLQYHQATQVETLDEASRLAAAEYLRGQFKRVQNLIRQNYMEGRLKAWEAAHQMTATFEAMAELATFIDDLNQAKADLADAIQLQKGTGWEIACRQTLAELEPDQKRDHLKQILNQIETVSLTKPRGHYRGYVAIALSQTYASEGRLDEAITTMESHFTVAVAQQNTIALSDWTYYLDMLRQANETLDGRLTSGVAPLLNKRLYDPSFNHALREERALLAENWRGFMNHPKESSDLANLAK